MNNVVVPDKDPFTTYTDIDAFARAMIHQGDDMSDELIEQVKTAAEAKRAVVNEMQAEMKPGEADRLAPLIRDEARAIDRIDFSALHKLLTEQQAVIDRLPKTADGVPVTPGMLIWFLCNEGYIEPYLAVGSDSGGSILTYPDAPPAETDFTEDLDGMSADRCYSTPEAARAAIAKAGGAA